MSDTTELAVQPETNLMSIIAGLASRPEVDIDKLHRLLEMQEKWELNQAKKDFREAMAKFKMNPPKIVKDTHVRFENSTGKVTEYDHASLDAVCQAIVKTLAEEGITHRWVPTQSGANITVACILSFGVYSEETSLTAQADTSGGKNAIQSLASTVSYLERYTLTAAAGVATGMPNDDGRGPNEAIKALAEDIYRAATMDDLQKLWTTAYAAAEKRGDKAAMTEYDKAREARLAELLAVEAEGFKALLAEHPTAESLNSLKQLMIDQPRFKQAAVIEAKARGYKTNKTTGMWEEVAK